MLTSSNMKTTTKITPEVLLWARVTAGMSEEYVADKIKLKRVSANDISEWESGSGAPTYAQLEKLARLYRRPIAIFFFPGPPSESGPKEQFRSLPEVYSETIPTRIRFLVRDALSMQINLRELFDGRDPAEKKIIKDMQAGGNISPVRLAERVRGYMGISLDIQFGWKDDDTALKQWRNALENYGLWIFKDAFREDNYSGFCLHDEQFPLIYVNNSMSKTRQIFTLFHELAHLLRGTGGIDILQDVMPELTGSYEREEVFCNAFAGAILVPEKTFPADMDSPDIQQIKELAMKYNVSQEVILRRFLDKNLISQDEYKNRVEQWKKSETSRNKKSSSGGDYYAVRRAYLGDRYLDIAFQQYHKQRITRHELADYLGVPKTKSLDSIESYVLGKWQQ